VSRLSAGRDALGSATTRLAGAWRGLDVYLRRRLALAVAAVVAVVALAVFAVPALPCGFPGGGQCSPPDAAAGLVPADALAYVHVDVEGSSDQYRSAAAMADRVPNLSAQLTSRLLRLPAASPSSAAFERSVRPWLGDEVALALLPAARAPQEVELLAAADESGARRYQSAIAGSRARTVTYRGVRVEIGRGRIASAILRGFLVIGTGRGTRSVIDAATGAKGAASLDSSAAAGSVRDELPDERVADAYLSPSGVAALAGRPASLLSSLAPFLAPGSTEGVAAALVAGGGGLELEVRSELDPHRAKAKPGFFAAFPSFDPTLASSLPAGTLAYVGIGRPADAIAALDRQARTEEPGLARALSRLLRQARRAGHVDVRRDLLPALGDEGALALEPGPSGAPTGSPYALYVGSGVDPAKARAALARLQTPIARRLGSAPGAASFHARRIGGVVAQTLPVSPAIELSYAIVRNRLVIATAPAGIAAVVRGGGLDASPRFAAATSGLAASPSVLGYFDLGGLLTLAERAGLAQDPAYATFAPELHRLEALGVSVAGSAGLLATDARLAVNPGG
jgi:uncharacterized protein DUF3352